MRTVFKSVMILLMLGIGVTGCAPQGPPFGKVAENLPPIPAGAARIFVYRWLEPYETLAPTTLFLNQRPVGVTEPGAVLYRDVPAGQYLISVQSEGVYPNQFKSVVLRPGESAYVRVESLRSWVPCGGSGGGDGAGGGAEGCADTFVVNIVAPIVGQTEMRGLRYIAG